MSSQHKKGPACQADIHPDDIDYDGNMDARCPICYTPLDFAPLYDTDEEE
jgi:hypothetical protein